MPEFSAPFRSTVSRAARQSRTGPDVPRAPRRGWCALAQELGGAWAEHLLSANLPLVPVDAASVGTQAPPNPGLRPWPATERDLRGRPTGGVPRRCRGICHGRTACLCRMLSESICRHVRAFTAEIGLAIAMTSGSRRTTSGVLRIRPVRMAQAVFGRAGRGDDGAMGLVSDLARASPHAAPSRPRPSSERLR
jgi:hypothetical protein